MDETLPWGGGGGGKPPRLPKNGIGLVGLEASRCRNRPSAVAKPRDKSHVLWWVKDWQGKVNSDSMSRDKYVFFLHAEALLRSPKALVLKKPNKPANW